MMFRMDNLGDSNAFLEVEKKEGWLEISTGYPNSARRTSVTGINRKESLALAAALQGLAARLE